MFQQLKQKSIRRAAVFAAILIAASIVLLYVTGFGMFKMLGGAKNLDDLAADQLEGQYVEAEVYVIFDWYAYTEQSKKGSPTKTVVSKEYIIPVGENEYMGLFLPKSDIQKGEQLLKESEEYFNEERDFPESFFTVKGTILPMDEESVNYFHEVVGYDDYDAATQAYFLPYYLKVGYIGATESYLTYLLSALALVCFAIALYLLIRAISGGYQKEVLDYCRKSADRDEMMGKLADFYDNTTPVGGIRFGAQWTIFQTGAHTHLIETPDLIWAYQNTTQHRTNGIPTGKTFALVLRTRGRKMHTVSMKNEAAVQEVLQYLSTRFPHIVLGYTPELEQLYKSDIERFAALPQERAAAQAAEPTPTV